MGNIFAGAAGMILSIGWIVLLIATIIVVFKMAKEIAYIRDILEEYLVHRIDSGKDVFED